MLKYTGNPYSNGYKRPYLGVAVSECQFIYTGSVLTLNALSLPAGKSVSFNWGDGAVSVIAGPQTNYTTPHNYAGAGAYVIRISGDIDSITKFSIISQAGLSGDIVTISRLTSLVDLALQNTSVTGDIVTTNGLKSLVTMRLNNTSVTGDIASISGLASLTVLRIYSSLIDNYTQGTLPNWDACAIFIQDLGLSQQEVDDFLCDLDTSSTASTKTLDISGTNSAPSAAGLICRDSLVTKGWAVTVTP